MQLYYKEYQPSEALRPYVVGYWSLHTDGSDEEQSPLQRCFPAGTIEWITRIRGRNMVGLREDGLFTYPDSIFTGVCDRAACWYGFGNAELFGVRFTPEGAIRLFGTPLKEYQNSFLNTEDFLASPITPVLSNLVSAAKVAERIWIAETFLHNRIRSRELENNYFTRALQLIRQHDDLAISELSRQVFVGERQLQRSFQQYLGISPKTYYRVMRLYKAHQRGLIRQDNFTSIAYTFGYADPAHFTRDFRDYFGVSPEQHFSSINMKWVA